MGKIRTFKSLASGFKKKLIKSVGEETPFAVAPANKLVNMFSKGEKDRVNKIYSKYINEPILKADVSLGMMARQVQKKITGKSGTFFTEPRLLDGGSKGAGKTGKVEFDVPSIMAPVSKVGKFALPILGTMKAQELLEGSKKMSGNKVITKADLKKTATMLNGLHTRNKQLEKKAQATKLLYKQAELGQILFPKSHGEFEEKVAELMHKDLNVVEEAIKMAAASEELNNTFGGSLSSPAGTQSLGDEPQGGDAQKAFQQSIIGE